MKNNYTEKTLVKGEKIILNTTMSKWELYLGWIFVVLPLIVLLVTIVLAEGVAGAIFGTGVAVGSAIWSIGSLFAIIGYYFTEFSITNKKVLAKKGIISRRTDELQLKKIEGVDVTQGIFGRMLGFGSIVISGTGSQKVVFNGVDNPLAIKKQIDSII